MGVEKDHADDENITNTLGSGINDGVIYPLTSAGRMPEGGNALQ